MLVGSWVKLGNMYTFIRKILVHPNMSIYNRKYQMQSNQISLDKSILHSFVVNSTAVGLVKTYFSGPSSYTNYQIHMFEVDYQLQKN